LALAIVDGCGSAIFVADAHDLARIIDHCHHAVRIDLRFIAREAAGELGLQALDIYGLSEVMGPGVACDVGWSATA
jgi:hypothetical protein